VTDYSLKKHISRHLLPPFVVVVVVVVVIIIIIISVISFAEQNP
jgi:lipopolysaccharide export LptBFGC system permease protein LptF